MMLNEPTLSPANQSHRGVMLWQWGVPVTTLSSASVGGGLAEPSWVVNIGVPFDYVRTDLAEHVAEIATDHELVGEGVGLFTAAHIARFGRSFCDGVLAHATVGISTPTWASDPADSAKVWAPGTINIVVQLPVGLEPGAAVNAVMTVTEAKTQALFELGVDGTGTASDAVVIVWPTHAPRERFAGPRAQWGARIAQATHAAVRAGSQAWLMP